MSRGLNWALRTNSRTGQNIDYHDWHELFYALPLIDMDTIAGRALGFWKEWIQQLSGASSCEHCAQEPSWGTIHVPAYNMGGWYDIYAEATFSNFNGLRKEGGSSAARQSKLICGPWAHALSTSPRTGEIDFGTGSLADLEAEEIRWFDYWLKNVDNGIAEEPPLRLFVMGANVWREESEWPLPDTDWQHWYLHSGGRANSLRGDGALTREEPANEPTDHYAYDPIHPVLTRGGNNLTSTSIHPVVRELCAAGPYDQRQVESRSDVLCYSSQPLEHELEVIGPVRMILYASTDALDTDWTAKLVDVFPSGYAMNLCDGIVRARFRGDRGQQPSLLEVGRVYAYEIEVGVTANLFRRGHRIRVEISSSNFPRFDRNLNTGRDVGLDSDHRVANQTVYHERQHPSHLVLPIIL